MKIGVDIRTLMDKEYSGVSWFTFDLISEILRQDQANEYVLFYNSWRKLDKVIPKFSGNNVSLVSTGYPNKFFNYILQKIFSWPKLDKAIGGVDVFLSPHINFTSLSKGVKNVLVIHDLSFKRYKEYFSWRKNFWHRMLGLKKIISRADTIVAVSENTKKDLEELLGTPADKIKVIYSGLSSDFSPIDNADKRVSLIKQKYELPKKFILFLSTIEPRKNVSGLLQAFDRALDFSELSDYCLVIAGRLGWKEKGVIETFDQMRHKNKVKFLGYVNNKDKVFLYNLAKVFIYPSLYEGFGFPPLEAMASGTPVITSANSSLVEAVDDSALLADPENIESLAQAMRQLIKDEKLRQILTKKGLERSRKFNWTKTAAQYIEIFNSYKKQ